MDGRHAEAATERAPKGSARPVAPAGATLPVRGVIVTLATVVALLTVFTLASALGPRVRRAGMVVTETSPAGSMVAFDDASARAAAFLADRDSVVVVVPWTMDARDLLRLYHLENNLSARAALLDQLGIEELDAVLPEGTAISLVLTPARLTP